MDYKAVLFDCMEAHCWGWNLVNEEGHRPCLLHECCEHDVLAFPMFVGESIANCLDKAVEVIVGINGEDIGYVLFQIQGIPSDTYFDEVWQYQLNRGKVLINWSHHESAVKQSQLIAALIAEQHAGCNAAEVKEMFGEDVTA